MKKYKSLCKIEKPFKNQSIHDFVHIGFYICNNVQLTITLFGYGFTLGFVWYDVMEDKK